MQLAVAQSVGRRMQAKAPRRLLWIAGNFPRVGAPGRGVFNLRMAQALAIEHELDVIAPVPWVNAIRNSVPPEIGPDHLRVHYPRFWYVPKMMHDHHGTFLWWSIRRTVRRILRDSR